MCVPVCAQNSTSRYKIKSHINIGNENGVRKLQSNIKDHKATGQHG